MARDFNTLCELLQKAILTGDAQSVSPSEWLIDKPGRTAEEQLLPYINAYRWRIIDAVSEDYPALRNYLGNEHMGNLLAQYVEQTPSNYYSLVKYCQGFPDYISKNKGFFDKIHKDHLFSHELATLECSITEVFHMEECLPLTPDDVSTSDPARFGEATLKLREASQLHKFSFPVSFYLTNVYKEQSPEFPAMQESYIAVFRHEYKVWRLTLERAEYLLLQKLNTGLTIEESLQEVLQENDIEPELLFEPIGRWFNRWVNDRLLQKTEFFER